MQRAFESPPTQLTVNHAADVAGNAAAAVQLAMASHARYLVTSSLNLCPFLLQKALKVPVQVYQSSGWSWPEMIWLPQLQVGMDRHAEAEAVAAALERKTCAGTVAFKVE
jgi:hypothetical protein